MIMNNLSYIYPPMAISADIVLCCLLEETEQGFRKLNCIITSLNKYSQAYKSARRNSSPSLLSDENNILTIR